MIIDPGQLTRPITVRRRTIVDDPQWGPTETWADHLQIWAMLKRVTEDEIWAANQTFAQRVVTFVTNWFSDITETDRIVCEDITYDVLGIGEIGLRDGLEIKCKVLDP